MLLAILALGGVDFYAMGAFWQQEMGQLFGPDVYAIARVLIPMGFAFLLGCLGFSSAIDLSRGAIREVLVIAAALMTAGIGAMAAFNTISKPMAIGLSFLAMLGVGGLYIPPIVALTIISPDEILGAVVGLALSVRFIGGQVGYTILYNILQIKLTNNIPTLVAPGLVAAGVPADAVKGFIQALVDKNNTAVATTPGLTATKLPAILNAAAQGFNELFLQSFPIVYYAAIGFGGAAIIACLLLGNIRKYVTDRVAVDIH